MKTILLKTFVKRLRRTPLKIQSKFRARLKIFIENPTQPILNNHSVEKVFTGCRSINITGDYRAIFKIENELFVFVDIGTHSELYS